jgi:hypothetical protein
MPNAIALCRPFSGMPIFVQKTVFRCSLFPVRAAEKLGKPTIARLQ